MKRNILGSQHGVTPKQLQRYLDEFCWRFSRRDEEGGLFGLFEALVGTCVKASPLTWAAVAAGPGPP